MRRIKENELQEILENFNNTNINIESEGAVKLKILFKKVKITFLNNISEVEFKDNNNQIILKFGYIEEINLITENQINFQLENGLEVCIYK